jgi:hypothetical protein
MILPNATNVEVVQEQTKERRHAYYVIHRDKIKTRSRVWREKHKQKANEQSRAYYAKNRERVLSQGKQYRRDNRERVKLAEAGKHRRLKYGIDSTMFERMLIDCNRSCSACKTTFSNSVRIAVDHNHSTGAIRGLLCHPCNFAAGRVFDDPGTLRRLAQYLIEAGAPRSS